MVSALRDLGVWDGLQWGLGIVAAMQSSSPPYSPYISEPAFVEVDAAFDDVVNEPFPGRSVTNGLVDS